MQLLPTERLEEMDGRLAVTDEDSRGIRYVKFWVGGQVAQEKGEHHPWVKKGLLVPRVLRCPFHHFQA